MRRKNEILEAKGIRAPRNRDGPGMKGLRNIQENRFRAIWISRFRL
jgi:hypothetical protein